jgi:hypothetical protein
MTSPPPPKFPTVDADAPFHSNPRADLIIRSSDGVDFFVLRLLVTTDTLSFFTNILEDGQSDQVNQDGLPILGPFDEPSTTIRPLLLCCYPLTMTGGIVPSFKTIEDLLMVSQMARKYGMDSIFPALQPAVVASSPIMNKTPALQLYSLGVQYGWEGVCKKAARRYLDIPTDHLFDGATTAFVKNISGSDILRLQQYRLRCRLAVQRVLTARSIAPPHRDLGWFHDTSLWRPDNHAHQDVHTAAASGSLRYRRIAPQGRLIHEWAIRYLDDMEAALLDCPSLAAADPKIKNAIKKLNDAVQDCPVCSSSAGTDVHLFVTETAAMVEQTISLVRIVLLP